MSVPRCAATCVCCGVGDVVTLRVLFDDELTGLAGQQRVVLVFDPVETAAVGADVPDEGARDCARRDSGAPLRARSRCPAAAVGRPPARRCRGQCGRCTRTGEGLRWCPCRTARGATSLPERARSARASRPPRLGRRPVWDRRRSSCARSTSRGRGRCGRRRSPAPRRRGIVCSACSTDEVLVLVAAEDLQLRDARREQGEREDHHGRQDAEPAAGIRRRDDARLARWTPVILRRGTTGARRDPRRPTTRAPATLRAGGVEDGPAGVRPAYGLSSRCPFVRS